MKPRLVVLHPFGTGNAYSGPTVLLDRLFGELGDHYDITLLYGSRSTLDSGFKWAQTNVRLFAFSSYEWPQQLQWSLRSTYWLLRNRRQYDLLHIQGAAFFNIICTLPLTIFGVRYVILPLAEGGEVSPRSTTSRLPVLRNVKRHVLRKARAVFALSDGVAEELVNTGLREDQIQPLRNPIALDVLPTPRVSAPPDRQHCTIGYVGKVYSVKQPDLVIRAAAHLRDHGIGVRCLFIGPYGSDEESRLIAELAAKLDMSDRVSVTGFTRSVAEHLKRLDIFVLPSSKEGLPGSLVEAMAAGIPAIVTDVGAMGDLVRAARGGTVVSPEVATIVDAVNDLLDGARYREASQNAAGFTRARYRSDIVAHAYATTVDFALGR